MKYYKKAGCRRGYSLQSQPNYFVCVSDKVRMFFNSGGSQTYNEGHTLRKRLEYRNKKTIKALRRLEKRLANQLIKERQYETYNG